MVITKSKLGHKFEVEPAAYKAIVSSLEQLEILGFYTDMAGRFAQNIARTVRQAVEDIEEENGRFPGLEGNVLEAVRHECEIHHDKYLGDVEKLSHFLAAAIVNRFALKIGQGRDWSNQP